MRISEAVEYCEYLSLMLLRYARKEFVYAVHASCLRLDERAKLFG